MTEKIRIVTEKNQKIVEINTIDETDDIVYIGPDFPDEYTHSNYKKTAFGTIGKAKAMNGWYYGIIHFTLPTTDDKGNITGRNKFKGRMVIRCDADKKLYLYDIIDIKKET